MRREGLLTELRENVLGSVVVWRCGEPVGCGGVGGCEEAWAAWSITLQVVGLGKAGVEGLPGQR